MASCPRGGLAVHVQPLILESGRWLGDLPHRCNAQPVGACSRRDRAKQAFAECNLLDIWPLKGHTFPNRHKRYLFNCNSVRLALHTDYALRTLIFLAGKPARASVAQIAEFFQISRDHVAKVVQSLVRFGYVRSIRGQGGGIELVKQPDEIRVGQVILDFEGNMHLLECIAINNICVIQPGCRLKGVLAQAEKIQLDYLQSMRLSDVVRPGGQLLEITAASGGAKP